MTNPKHPWKGWHVQQPVLWEKHGKARLYLPLNSHRLQAGYIDLIHGMYRVQAGLNEDQAIQAEMILSEALKELQEQAGK